MNRSNFKIGHNINDITEGVEYEFTLKDRNVLDENDDELEEIENAVIKEMNKKKNKKEKIFDYEEKREILPHYNKEEEESFIIKREDFNENEENIEKLLENKSEELNKIRDRLRQMKEQKLGGVGRLLNQKVQKVNKNLNNIIQTDSVQTPKIKNAEQELKVEKKFISDYMTQEEFKNKEFKKVRSIPVKKRIKSDLEEEELIKINTEKNNVSNSQVYDEYDELNLFLEQQRNLINKEKKPKVINDTIVENKGMKPEMVELIAKEIPKEETEEEKVEFISDTTEFLKKIPTKKEIEENYNLITSHTHISLRDVKSGTQSVVNIPLPSDRLRYGVSSVIKNEDTRMLNNKTQRADTLQEEDNKSVATKVDENEEEKVEALEEPLVGKGVAVALSVLRKRGLIGKKEMWGRYKDKTYTTNDMFLSKEELEKKEKDAAKNRLKKEFDHDVEIEYRDNKGRLLTPKEMYRYQSYLFHGKGPGKKKIEKRLLREQLEAKLKNRDPTSLSKSFVYLKNLQKKNNTPYLVLQGKNSTLQ